MKIRIELFALDFIQNCKLERVQSQYVRVGFSIHHQKLLSEFRVNQILPTNRRCFKSFLIALAKKQTFKKRMKFLIKDIGRDEFLNLVDEDENP
jgi:hypothetical protein